MKRRYIPDGNVKFGAVTIDTTNEEQAVMKYQLFVDGKEEWSWVLTAPSAHRARDIRRQWS
jgi:alkaline phosphatase D